MLCLVFVFSCSSPSSLCVVFCCVCLVPLPRAVPLCLVSCFFVLVFVCFFGRSFVRCFVCLVRVCLFVVLVVGLGWLCFGCLFLVWFVSPSSSCLVVRVCVCVFVPGFHAALHACFTRLPCMIYVLDSFHASFPPLGGFPFSAVRRPGSSSCRLPFPLPGLASRFPRSLPPPAPFFSLLPPLFCVLVQKASCLQSPLPLCFLTRLS